MSQRIDDLQRREQELAARESQLNAKAEHIRRHGRNNWPPGPFPLLFHDIDMEIPDDHKATVLTLYRIWMLLVIVLVVNLVSAILLLISGANNGGADLGAAIMYVPVIGVSLRVLLPNVTRADEPVKILSFFTWYRPVYNAYMKESSVFYCRLPYPLPLPLPPRVAVQTRSWARDAENTRLMLARRHLFLLRHLAHPLLHLLLHRDPRIWSRRCHQPHLALRVWIHRCGSLLYPQHDRMGARGTWESVDAQAGAFFFVLTHRTSSY